MSDVYENCPAFENDKFLLRFSQLDDAEDLVSVYSDKNALPFFNSDNCHGDNFYYPNEDRMRQAIKFWLSSYSSKWLDCQHFFRQIFLGYFSDIVQAFDTLRKNVCGDDYTSLHNPIVLSSVLPAYGMFHSIQILFL